MEDSSVDYKELYFSLFRATEGAIRLLIDAQRTCEERYLAACEAEDPTAPAPHSTDET